MLLEYISLELQQKPTFAASLVFFTYFSLSLHDEHLLLIRGFICVGNSRF